MRKGILAAFCVLTIMASTAPIFAADTTTTKNPVTLTDAQLTKLTAIQTKLTDLVTKIESLKTTYKSTKKTKGLLTALNQFEKQAKSLNTAITNYKKNPTAKAKAIKQPAAPTASRLKSRSDILLRSMTTWSSGLPSPSELSISPVPGTPLEAKSEQILVTSNQAGDCLRNRGKSSRLSHLQKCNLTRARRSRCEAECRACTRDAGAADTRSKSRKTPIGNIRRGIDVVAGCRSNGAGWRKGGVLNELVGGSGWSNRKGRCHCE